MAITHSPRFTPVFAPKSSTGQILRVDLDDGDVGALVGADDLGGVFAAVGQLHDDFGGAVDDVRVRDDVAVRAHDEARAQAARRLLRAHALALAGDAAEALEEIEIRAVLVDIVGVDPLELAVVQHADVDDGRSGAIHELGEIGERSGSRGRLGNRDHGRLRRRLRHRKRPTCRNACSLSPLRRRGRRRAGRRLLC
jgi:hypothetical protein